MRKCNISHGNNKGIDLTAYLHSLDPFSHDKHLIHYLKTKM